MHCPHPDCPAPAMVNRRDAVEAVCKELSTALSGDAGLIDLVMASFAKQEDHDGEDLERRIEAAERKVHALNRKMAGLEKLLGDGSDDDCLRREGEIRAAQSERDQEQLKLARLRRWRGGGRDEPVTRGQVEQAVADLCGLLDAAARGELGRDVIGKAVDVFAALVGGEVRVHAHLRPGRKRWLACGHFTPNLLGALRAALGADESAAPSDVEELKVWLRKPPRVDRLADEVRHLYEVEQLSFSAINDLLEKKYGEKIGSGNCCAAWRRWYEIRQLPLPAPRGNMGRPRKRAS